MFLCHYDLRIISGRTGSVVFYVTVFILAVTMTLYELGPVNSDIDTIRLIGRNDLTLELIEMDFNERPPNDASYRLTT